MKKHWNQLTFAICLILTSCGSSLLNKASSNEVAFSDAKSSNNESSYDLINNSKGDFSNEKTPLSFASDEVSSSYSEEHYSSENSNIPYNQFLFHTNLINIDNVTKNEAYIINNYLDFLYFKDLSRYENLKTGEKDDDIDAFCGFMSYIDETFFSNNYVLVTMAIPCMSSQNSFITSRWINDSFILDYQYVASMYAWTNFHSCDLFAIPKEKVLRQLKVTLHYADSSTQEFEQSF